MMHLLLAIVRKELLDGFRDRRALMSALIFPLFGPVLISVMLNVAADDIERPIELAVVAPENAPELVSFLEMQGVELQPPPDDPEQSVRLGEIDVVLVIPDDFGEAFRDGRPAPLELVVDTSRDAAKSAIARSKNLLNAYAGQLGTFRLLARGVNPSIVNPLDIDQVDLATPEKQAAGLLEMIVMFVVMAAFICNMYIAIDATAGERERRSLEPLLLNPVSRRVLVLGKWLAAVVFGVIGLLLTLVIILVSLQFLSIESMGFRIEMGAETSLLILLITLPLAFLAGALQLMVASFTRSFKEAQTYLSITLFMPMAPGMILTMKPLNPEGWMMFVPMLSQQVLAGELLRGDGLDPTQWLTATVMVLVMSGVFLWLTVWRFRSESMLFGK